MRHITHIQKTPRDRPNHAIQEVPQASRKVHQSPIQHYSTTTYRQSRAKPTPISAESIYLPQLPALPSRRRNSMPLPLYMPKILEGTHGATTSPRARGIITEDPTLEPRRTFAPPQIHQADEEIRRCLRRNPRRKTANKQNKGLNPTAPLRHPLAPGDHVR
jgi:hypothetical protein